MIEEPRFIREGYAYIDSKTEEWCLKEDAPEWAVKEFEEFFQAVNPKPNDNNIMTVY